MNSNSTTNVAALTVIIVIAGQWAKKDKILPIKIIIGGVVYILILSALNSGAPKLARNFAILVMLSAVFIYAIPVFQGLGLLDKPKKGVGKGSKRP